jgi:beta-galactosidase
LHEESWRPVKQYPFLSGMFVWTGFDYLGEPTPYDWPARSSYFGIVDLAGFPKDPFYLYQSEWTDRPVLHVFPHWNWTPGDTIDVWAYTNADEVELSLNGRSLGKRRKEGDVMHLMWRVPYEPGVLRAVARRNGQVAESQEVRTAGPPPHRADLTEASALMARISARHRERRGPGRPAGANRRQLGPSGSRAAWHRRRGQRRPDQPRALQAEQVHAFNGKGLVIVQAGRQRGAVTLTATSAGLAPASARITLAGH